MNLPTTKQLQIQAMDSLAKVAKQHAKSSSSTTTLKQSAPKQTKPRSTIKPKSETPGKTIISIQHMSAAKPKQQYRLLYDVLSFLKEVNKRVTVEELLNEIPGYDFKNADIAAQLAQNPKILFEEGKYYSFKPLYPVKNINELLDLVNRSPNGIEVEQLKDAYKALEIDLKKLAEQQDVMLVRNEETKFDVVYPNDPRYRLAVSMEFVKMWKAIKSPDEVGLENALNLAGIASAKEEEVKPVKRPSKKKEARKRKLTKITNTHILGTGFDITKDYAAQK